jgi:hypothetical protein
MTDTDPRQLWENRGALFEHHLTGRPGEPVLPAAPVPVTEAVWERRGELFEQHILRRGQPVTETVETLAGRILEAAGRDVLGALQAGRQVADAQPTPERRDAVMAAVKAGIRAR